ncbi:MAG: efflux RND transporter periplasmic adaptor subunit, partial [Planctomycetota bacterium]
MLKALVSVSAVIAIAVTPTLAQESDAKPALVEVVAAVLTAEMNTEIVLTGTVVSQRRSALSTRAEGLVEKILIDAGSQVTEGALLLQLDTRLAEIDLALVRAEIEAAKVQLEDAIRQRDEVRELAKDGGFARTEAASREAMTRVRQAELSALEAREEQQLERIERHKLVAPFSGTIAQKATEAGEWVDTGAMVFELVETDELWFDLQVAQEFLSSVKKSTSAKLILDAFPRQEFEAKVDVFVPVKDPVSRTFLTRLTFDDPEKLASPGMSGEARLQVDPGDDTSV